LLQCKPAGGQRNQAVYRRPERAVPHRLWRETSLFKPVEQFYGMLIDGFPVTVAVGVEQIAPHSLRIHTMPETSGYRKWIGWTAALVKGPSDGGSRQGRDLAESIGKAGRNSRNLMDAP
jgi:hypothetical protein